MARGVLFALFAISMLSLAAFSFYQNIPRNSIILNEDKAVPDEVARIEYGPTPVFSKNMRFNHNNISYKIDSSCSKGRAKSMREAFGVFEEQMQVVSFYETSGEADIGVGCSNDYISVGEHLFAAGEGGPSKIINTSEFNVIQKGKIVLYDDERCIYPVVEIHELGHVFGFAHTKNPYGVMYNTSRCNQRITNDMIQLIHDLYSIKPLPDVLIKKITAVKRGRYLDFNITILNGGLMNAKDIDLTIIANNKTIQVVNTNALGIGYGRTLEAKNIKLPSYNTNEVVFYLDYKNKIEELNKANNIKIMRVGT